MNNDNDTNIFGKTGIIDKDARFFGKINIIDLLIIMGLIGAIVFGVIQLRGGDGGIGTFIGTETREFEIRFYTPDVESFAAYAVNVGDNAFDNGRNVAMGVVTGVEVGPAIVWNADQYGNTVVSDREGFSSIEITAVLSATPSENGILIAGNRYGVGHSLPVRAGRSIIFMRISGLQEVEA